MAINWETAQKNEKYFWDTIYVNQKNDIETYTQGNETFHAHFSFQTFKKHKINIYTLENNTLVDLGCGPYGIIRGLSLFCKPHFNLLVGVDPLMDHYKTYGVLQESNMLKLHTGKVEEYNSNIRFDIVHSSNVVDHVDNPDSFVQTARRLTKDDGVFMVSVHCINDVFIPFKRLLKYVDKNHPHHFDEREFLKLLNKHFSRVELISVVGMIESQPDFSFWNILRYRTLRSVKRYLSTLLMKSYYFNCYPKQ